MQAGIVKGKGDDRNRDPSGNSGRGSKHCGRRAGLENEKTGVRKQTTEIGACLKKKTD